MFSFSMQGKVALVTGSSRGIGKAVAKTLADHGARCILASRKSSALDQVVAEIKEGGGDADAVVCHMGRMNQIRSLIQNVEAEYGRLDILVNNAAVNPHYGSMLTIDEQVWDKINEVNLKGPFFLTQRAAPLMAKSGGGTIINISSVEAKRPSPDLAAYAIAKAGMVCMTQAFAKELAAKNIRVNAVLPGLVKTALSTALFKDPSFYNRAMSQISLGRHAQPEEIAGAVLYLASDAAAYVTGACLACDGGATA